MGSRFTASDRYIWPFDESDKTLQEFNDMLKDMVDRDNPTVDPFLWDIKGKPERLPRQGILKNFNKPAAVPPGKGCSLIYPGTFREVKMNSSYRPLTTRKGKTLKKQPGASSPTLPLRMKDIMAESDL